MSNRSASPSPSQPVALVTGASDRIGAAIALALARAGHAVVIHYRSNADGARAVRAAIRANGGQAEMVKADLAKRPQRAALIGKAAGFFGPLT
ncbi:MAG: SDR family NAD(P)-dependent oxidoreductase, partial [Devosia sp.]